MVDPKGNVVAGGDHTPFEPLPFTVPKTGTYYVVVTGGGYGNGPYTVALSIPSPVPSLARGDQGVGRSPG